MKVNRTVATAAENEFHDWMARQIHRVVTMVVKAVVEDGRKELPGVPPEIIRNIHNIVAFHFLTVVNFPSDALPSGVDREASALAYDEFAKSLSDAYLEFCSALSNWRPDSARMGVTTESSRRSNGRRVAVLADAGQVHKA